MLRKGGTSRRGGQVGSIAKPLSLYYKTREIYSPRSEIIKIKYEREKRGHDFLVKTRVPIF